MNCLKRSVPSGLQQPGGWRRWGFVAGALGVLALGATHQRFSAAVPPAPQVSVTPTPALVRRGAYLANSVASCMDCHSQRDFSRLAGPIAPGTFGGGGERFGEELGLPGTFYGKNLTPTALRDWTDGDLYRAITAGIDRSGEPLFPIMPYLHYRTMDDRDTYAIIAYLRTLNPHPNRVPARVLKVPRQALLAFPHEARPGTRPVESDSVAYGRYLVNLAHCIECHSPKVNGEIVPGKEFSGGTSFQLPTGTVYASNLTPDHETGLGYWTADAFVARFKTYAPENYRPHRVEKGGFNTIMPWTQYGTMRDSDLRAIFAYLKSRPPVRNRVKSFEPK